MTSLWLEVIINILEKVAEMYAIANLLQTVDGTAVAVDRVEPLTTTVARLPPQNRSAGP